MAGWFIFAAVTYPILGGAAWLVWPVIMGVVTWHKIRGQQRHIAHLAAEKDRTAKIAAEKQAIADRLAEEEYTAWQEAHRAQSRMETAR